MTDLERRILDLANGPRRAIALLCLAAEDELGKATELLSAFVFYSKRRIETEADADSFDKALEDAGRLLERERKRQG